MLKYLALDPGENIGWATFDEKGELIEYGQLQGEIEFDGFLDRLAETPPHTIIYEDYKIFSHQLGANIGTDVPTLQCVGVIKKFGRTMNCTIVKQPPSILPIAEKFAGVKMPANHAVSHQISALLHGVYYLTQHGIRRPRILDETQVQHKP